MKWPCQLGHLVYHGGSPGVQSIDSTEAIRVWQRILTEILYWTMSFGSDEEKTRRQIRK
jgi:hypothetical protein